MGKRKRTSRRAGLVNRAVRAGRSALRQAENRIPPDLRRQLQQRLKDADRTARAAVKQLQAQVQRASTRADVNSVLKRIDGLTRQARQIARTRTPARTATRKRATTTTRRATSRTKKAAPRRAAAPRKTAAARAATPRKARTPRRRRTAETTAPMPEIVEVPITEVGEIDVYEITEP